MKKFLMLSLASFVFLSLTTSICAEPSIIEREIIIDVVRDRTTLMSSTFAAKVWIDDVAFQTGDTLIARIRFNKNQALEVSALDGVYDLELTKLSFKVKDPPSHNNWNISGSYTYVGVWGDLLTNPISFNGGGGGGALLALFHHANLTDSSFSYHGVDIQLNFDYYELTSGSGVFDYIEFTSKAENVQTVDAPYSITVTSPNGGEELLAGTTHEITWASEGDIYYVKIEYSVNNGIDWIEIVTSTENDSPYNWNVPCDLSTNSLIRVSTIDGGFSDTSDSVFAIVDNTPPVYHNISSKRVSMASK